MGARSFYTNATKYLLKSLPLDNLVLKHLQCLHPLMRTHPSSLDSIKYLVTKLPHIISPDNSSTLLDEWIILQTESTNILNVHVVEDDVNFDK